MKIAMSTAGSGVYPQHRTGSFPTVTAPVRVPRYQPVDVSRLPAEAVPRSKRAPPPADADYDILMYLVFTFVFLLMVWR